MQPLLGSSIQWSCKQYFPILFMCAHWYKTTYVYIFIYICMYVHWMYIDLSLHILNRWIDRCASGHVHACNGTISYNDIVGICVSMPCTVTYVNTVSGWNTRHTMLDRSSQHCLCWIQAAGRPKYKSDRIKHAFPMLQWFSAETCERL